MVSQTDGIHFGFRRQYVKLFFGRLAELARQNAPAITVTLMEGSAYKTAPPCIAFSWGMSVVTLEESREDHPVTGVSHAFLGRFSSHSSPRKPMDHQTAIPITGNPALDLKACADYLHRCSVASSPSQEHSSEAQKGFLRLVTPDNEGH